MPPFETGCILVPPSADNPQIEDILGAVGELPEQYIVPYYRSWFDADFKVIPVNVRIKNQGQRPSCVGQAVAYQKEAQERIPMSARDIYRQAKQMDGSGDPLSWGTTIQAAQDVLIAHGSATEAVVPELPLNQSTATYVGLGDVTTGTILSRVAHKAKRTYAVGRNVFKQTLFETQLPFVTSTMWYTGDNMLGADGIMIMPAGAMIGGHAFICIGWIVRDGKEYLVMINSWSKEWGHHGLFFMSTADVINRLTPGYITVDLPPNLIDILEQFNGRNVQVKNNPRIYKIENGKKRWYPNELVWWAFKNLFGFEIYTITQEELDVVPVGLDMDIADAPWEGRELIRQIRAYYNLT